MSPDRLFPDNRGPNFAPQYGIVKLVDGPDAGMIFEIET